MSAGRTTPSETALTLRCLPESLAIVRAEAGAPIPDWTASSGWISIVRTAEELSIVCEDRLVPCDVVADRAWRALMIRGPLPLTMIGVLAAVSDVLARAGVSIFAISTYDTDYILVPEAMVEKAIAALTASGHTVDESSGDVR